MGHILNDRPALGVLVHGGGGVIHIGVTNSITHTADQTNTLGDSQ